MMDTGDDPRTKGTARRVEIFTGAGHRRRWSAEDKARIIAECMAPGASVSSVARHYGLTSSQIFRWRRTGPLASGGSTNVSFAPVVVSDRTLPSPGERVIEIELRDVKLRIPSRTRAATIVALVKALGCGR
jgi:transposase